MKNKQVIVSILLIFLIIGLLNGIYSDATDAITASGDKLIEGADKIYDIKEDLEDDPGNYLKQEWIKFIDKTPFGPVLNKIGKFFVFINPLWKLILGMEYSFSWRFYLSLIILIMLLVYASKFLNALYYLPLEFVKFMALVKLGAIFLFLVILSLTRIPKYLAYALITFVSNKGEWWLQVIIWICVIAGIFLLVYFFDAIKKVFTAIKEEKRKKLEDFEKARKEKKERDAEEADKIKEQIEKRLGKAEKESASGKETNQEKLEKYVSEIEEFFRIMKELSPDDEEMKYVNERLKRLRIKVKKRTRVTQKDIEEKKDREATRDYEPGKD